jgi:hypothetical protein
MPPYLPPAEQGRQRLVDAIRQLDVVKRRSVRGGGRHLLFFAYALAMQVSKDTQAVLSRCTTCPSDSIRFGPIRHHCFYLARLGSALCSLLSALCSLLSALCSLRSALCSLLSALCSLLSALCALLSLSGIQGMDGFQLDRPGDPAPLSADRGSCCAECCDRS